MAVADSALFQPVQDKVLGIDQEPQQHENLKDHRRHFLYPLNRSVAVVNIPLDESIGDHGLRGAYVCPTSAEGVSGDLRHCK